MSNEYLEKFKKLQEQSTFRGQQWFGKRQQLVEEYSWAVPNEEVISYLAEFDELYEVGAGSGYWAKCIEEAGGSVYAFDKDSSKRWFPVHPDTHWDYEDSIEDSPVLMVWPPANDGMAADVASFNPSHILYVGEQRGGCTADARFFDQLDKYYGLVAKMDIPSYAGVHDQFYHYTRKV